MRTITSSPAAASGSRSPTMHTTTETIPELASLLLFHFLCPDESSGSLQLPAITPAWSRPSALDPPSSGEAMWADLRAADAEHAALQALLQEDHEAAAQSWQDAVLAHTYGPSGGSGDAACLGYAVLQGLAGILARASQKLVVGTLVTRFQVASWHRAGLAPAVCRLRQLNHPAAVRTTAAYLAERAATLATPGRAASAGLQEFCFKLLRYSLLSRTTVLVGLDLLGRRVDVARQAGDVFDPGENELKQLVLIAMYSGNVMHDDTPWRLCHWASFTGFAKANILAWQRDWLTAVDWNISEDAEAHGRWEADFDQWVGPQKAGVVAAARALARTTAARTRNGHKNYVRDVQRLTDGLRLVQARAPVFGSHVYEALECFMLREDMEQLHRTWAWLCGHYEGRRRAGAPSASSHGAESQCALAPGPSTPSSPSESEARFRRQRLAMWLQAVPD